MTEGCISAYLHTCAFAERGRDAIHLPACLLAARRLSPGEAAGAGGTYSNCGGCLLCPRLPNAICERGENDFCTVDTFCALMVSASLHLKNASLCTAHTEPTAFHREIAPNETPHSITFFSLQNIWISFLSRCCFSNWEGRWGGGWNLLLPPFFFPSSLQMGK